MDTKCRTNNGSHETIVSKYFEQRTLLNGIGNANKIGPIKLQVRLKDESNAKRFSFSCTWIVPRIILRMTAGHLALLKVTDLVPEIELEAEELLMGLPILQKLRSDMKSKLEQNRVDLNWIE